jgi:Tn3 transposase DDE domain
MNCNWQNVSLAIWLANYLIFYNVFEMNRMLNQLMQEGYSFSDAAISALNPYLTKHVNRLGRSPLDLERYPQL